MRHALRIAVVRLLENKERRSTKRLLQCALRRTAGRNARRTRRTWRTRSRRSRRNGRAWRRHGRRLAAQRLSAKWALARENPVRREHRLAAVRTLDGLRASAHTTWSEAHGFLLLLLVTKSSPCKHLDSHPLTPREAALPGGSQCSFACRKEGWTRARRRHVRGGGRARSSGQRKTIGEQMPTGRMQP